MELTIKKLKNEIIAVPVLLLLLGVSGCLLPSWSVNGWAFRIVVLGLFSYSTFALILNTYRMISYRGVEIGIAPQGVHIYRHRKLVEVKPWQSVSRLEYFGNDRTYVEFESHTVKRDQFYQLILKDDKNKEIIRVHTQNLGEILNYLKVFVAYSPALATNLVPQSRLLQSHFEIVYEQAQKCVIEPSPNLEGLIQSLNQREISKFPLLFAWLISGSILLILFILFI